MDALEGTSCNTEHACHQTVAPNRHAVLNTVELLEQILLHVDWKQTFAAQRVCRHFRDVIAKSALLKQKMFLTPRRAQSDSKPEDSGYNGRWIRCFTDHEQSGEEIWRERCPLVIPHGPRPGQPQDAQLQAYYFRLDLPATVTRDLRESWRKVFLCNPPVTEVYARIVSHRNDTLHELVSRIPNPSGVTVHDLIPDELRPFYRRLKGLSDCAGAYGCVPRDHAEHKTVEVPKHLLVEEGADTIPNLQRSVFAFYTPGMVKMGLEYYSSTVVDSI